MFKKTLIALLLIFAFLAASVYIFRTKIKDYAIATILKSFPLPNVALANVNFDETTGRLSLEDIAVKNPRGFSSKNILEADAVDMDISFVTKPALRLNISEIDIKNPVFFVERSRDDKWNFREYAAGMKLASSDAVHEGLIRNAHAAETESKTEFYLPRTVNINNGSLHFLDDYISYGGPHKIDLFPINGVVTMDYMPSSNNYKKIKFNGTCNIGGAAGRLIKGNMELYPASQGQPSYMIDFTTHDIPLATIKPYLDRYSPFIVMRGSFNMASSIRSTDGNIEGDYTMELMDLEFAVNPEKSNFAFMETSVKKLTLYLTNQKGNVILDFKQRGRIGQKINWSLGPITTRAIGMMALDTVIDIIEKTRQGGSQQPVPGDIPPEVIEIFKGILR